MKQIDLNTLKNQQADEDDSFPTDTIPLSAAENAADYGMSSVDFDFGATPVGYFLLFFAGVSFSDDADERIFV